MVMTQGTLPHNQSLGPGAGAPGLFLPQRHIYQSPFSYPFTELQNTRPSAQHVYPVDERFKKDRLWKYEGYSEFTKWMASDDDFFVFRRFGKLNAGVILWMQDRIMQIEQQLQILHEEIENAPEHEYRRNDSFRWDAKYEPDRNRLMGELTGLLHYYNEYITTYSQVRARPRAQRRQITNVGNWFKSKPGAIVDKERAFIDHEGDLIGVTSRARPLLGSLLEKSRLIRLSRPFREKPLSDTQVLSPYTSYTSDEAMETLTTVSIIVLGLAMLLGPMWWLEFVSDGQKRLGIITGFVFVFMIMMSSATVNRPFEVVASTAAYAAVLMVFLQLSGGNK